MDKKLTYEEFLEAMDIAHFTEMKIRICDDGTLRVLGYRFISVNIKKDCSITENDVAFHFITAAFDLKVWKNVDMIHLVVF